MKALRLLRRVPYAPLLLVLIFIAGIAEAIGISSLVPVASSLTGDFGNGGELPFPFYYLKSILDFFGLLYTFNNLLFCTLVLILFSFLAIFLQERMIAKARYKFCEKLRNESTKSIFFSTWEHLSDISSGELANKVIHESERGSESVMALISMIAGLIQISIYILFCILLSWKLSLVAMVTILSAALSSKYLVRRVSSLGKLSADVNTFYSKNLVDFIRGSKLIKATNLTTDAEKKLSEINNQSSSISTDILINQSKMKLQLQSILGGAMVLILYIAVSILGLNVSVLLVFLYIIIRLAPKFTTVQGLYFSYVAHLPSLDIVDEVISQGDLNKEISPTGANVFSEIKRNIVFENVSYKYPNEDQPVLKNISLEVVSNSFVAIVGKTGCGKSTLLDLVIGLIQPSEGNVSIDGIKTSEYDLDSYRNRIGFVPQEPTFFDGTIRENLCFGIETDDENIWDCLSSAQIKYFVKSLDEGLETPIGESGTRLSGGQRQRLAIARALIRSPSILILDEATSAMDSESEKDFQQTLEKIAKSYTLVVVAHRLSTIKKADKIFVLEEGTLVQEGDFKALNSKSGVFSNLVSVQFDLK